jgi:hypothetical protein
MLCGDMLLISVLPTVIWSGRWNDAAAVKQLFTWSVEMLAA